MIDLKKNEIIKIEKVNERIRYCNVCRGGTNLKKSKTTKLNEDIKMYELSFGNNNFYMTVSLCERCLNNFAEILWKFLEEEK